VREECDDGKVECDDCRFWRRCPCLGVSPVETKKGQVHCMVYARRLSGTLMAIPSVLGVDAMDGNVKSVQVRFLLFRRSWWRQLLRRP